MNTVPNTSVRLISLLLAAAATFSACQARDDRSAMADSPATATRADSGGKMGEMGGMHGMMGGATMDSMQAHMGMMDSMSGERMKEMLPMHRQMAANMLSQMNSEMRSMNMAANTTWTATVDSVRQDLIRLPEMSSQELSAAMPGHHARLKRLMEMHRDMMRSMKS